jgi:hypothetical protein
MNTFLKYLARTIIIAFAIPLVMIVGYVLIQHPLFVLYTILVILGLIAFVWAFMYLTDHGW